MKHVLTLLTTLLLAPLAALHGDEPEFGRLVSNQNKTLVIKTWLRL